MAINVKNTGFSKADAATDIAQRLICSISAEEKQGKTRFGLTMPAPIGFLNFDEGDEGLIAQFPDKEIYKADYPVVDKTGGNLDKVAKAADEVWNKFTKDYMFALDNFRSVVVDTGTEIWELLRVARFGKLTQVSPHQYGPVNAEFRNLIKEIFKPKYSHVNLCFLNKLGKEYKTTVRPTDGKEISNPTGALVRKGFGDMGFLVQLNAVAHRYSECVVTDTGAVKFKPVKATNGDNGFRLTILDSRHNAEMARTTLQGELLEFPWLAAMTTGQDREIFL